MVTTDQFELLVRVIVKVCTIRSDDEDGGRQMSNDGSAAGRSCRSAGVVGRREHMYTLQPVVQVVETAQFQSSLFILHQSQAHDSPQLSLLTVSVYSSHD